MTSSTRPWPTRGRGPGALVGLFVALALISGACSGDSSDPADVSSESEAGPDDTAEAPEGAVDESPAPQDEPTADEPESDEPAAGGGGTLVVAIDNDPGQFNPALTTSGGVHTASELMYNGLVYYDENFAPQPDLALDWDIEEEGRLYRFHLRDDVVWHDGTPFTSADVAYTFEEVLTTFHSRTTASVGALLESVETPDDTTVEFRFSEPYAPLMQQLDVTEAPIIATHVYEGTDPKENPANLAPVGTGPFMFSSHSPDEEIVLVRNPDYFKPGLPRVDRVVMRVIPDSGSQVIALEAGDVDWLWGVPGPDLARLSSDDSFQTLKTLVNPGGANCIMTVSFNLDRPALQDVRVRRAIAHGLDRTAFLERVAFGQGNVATAPVSSGIPTAYAAGLDLPDYGPDAARSLLQQAGWVSDGGGIRTASGVAGVPDGTPLAIGVHLFPRFAAYGELMKALLLEVGIDVEVKALERATMVDEVFVQRDFDTNMISYCNGTDPEVGIRRMYISGNITPIPFSNSSAYRNAEVDDLFDRARNTVDRDARAALYREMQEILVDELPYFWLIETTATRIHTSDCTGFRAFGHFAEAATCDRG